MTRSRSLRRPPSPDRSPGVAEAAPAGAHGHERPDDPDQPCPDLLYPDHPDSASEDADPEDIIGIGAEGAEPAARSGSAAARHVTIGPEDAAGRLDKALTGVLGDLSRSRLRMLIEAGYVSSGGRTIDDPSARVKPGQSFDIIIPDPEPAAPEPQPLPLVIVYEDEDVLVVDKPPGLVVHPAAGNRDHTLVNALLAHCAGRLSGIGGVMRPGIVHRLDKDTSGLMVVAKTDAAHAALAAQFADRSLSRTYLAVVRGVPQPPEGVIEAPIGRSPVDRKKMAVVGRGGKSALTRYRTLRRFGAAAGVASGAGAAAALVECTLATGRTHQIRVHLASIGHPVLGDPLYGGAAGRGGGAAGRPGLPPFPRQALHAAALRFFHPRTRQEIRLEAEVPHDMKGLLKTLEAL